MKEDENEVEAVQLLKTAIEQLSSAGATGDVNDDASASSSPSKFFLEVEAAIVKGGGSAAEACLACLLESPEDDPEGANLLHSRIALQPTAAGLVWLLAQVKDLRRVALIMRIAGVDLSVVN